MNRQLKILMLSDGGSYHTDRFLNSLRNSGCDIKLASLEKGDLVDYQMKKRFQIKYFHYILAVSELIKIIKDFKPDIISAHYATGYGYLAAKASKDIPIALNLWGSDILIVPHKSAFHKLKAVKALSAASVVFADSEYLLEEASKFANLKNKKVIPWGIESEALNYHRNDYSLSKPLKIIVPRMHKDVYNNFFIIDALDKLLNEKKIRISFPTKGDLYEAFKDKCAAYPEGTVNFYQPLDRNGFLEFMSRQDVYLSASKSDSSPVTLIEALGLGLIPVAGDIPGIREWLNKESGFIFDLENPATLLEIINKIIDSNSDFSPMRKANKERVEQEALFENNMKAHLEHMKELVKGSGKN